ncbi:hypothetical protein [Ideonella sp. A 288]|uniref:hypothetical protein n=1 Tax=Ideonella sp. A 288 TaxID=1962181 RepID=UPI000B4B45C7|nr:hypothetical protein [Ideonella sp. A 288]
MVRPVRRPVHCLVAVGLAFGALAAQAQAPQFPDGATTPTSADIKAYLDGKVFDVAIADGTRWRLEYKSNGYFFVDTSTGFRNSGTWQAEDGKLCGHLKGRDRGCNDVRLHQDLLHLKRDSGEIIRFTVK